MIPAPSLQPTQLTLSEAEISSPLSAGLHCRFRGNINAFVVLSLDILGCLLCNISYLKPTVRALQEEEMRAGGRFPGVKGCIRRF